MKKKRKIKKFQILIILWLIASLWGAINIFSASSINNIADGLSPYGPLIQQLIFIAISFTGLSFILGKRKPPYLIGKKGANIFHNGTLFLLAVVLVGGFLFPADGFFVRGGARSTIPLPIGSIQPLEIYKITMVLFLAKRFSTPGIYNNWSGILKTIGLAGLGLLLIALEPDMGGMLILAAVLGAMIFYNGQKIGTIMKILIPILIIVVIIGAISISGSYQAARFTAWLHPFANGNDLNESYNVVNGYIAISNGGALGSGFMNSIQKSGFLFAPHTDFIFTVICEEWGLFGATFTIGILVLLALQCFNIGYTAHERFGMMYSYGFGTLLLVQTFVNIGGVIGLIPMTGVTLPFISNGMNSYLILSAGLIYVIIIDKERIRQKKIRDDKADRLFMS